ncbi:NAD(P)H-dependent oxidoreductase [bacterium]|nr:NAD(P)H-dependent oxidoreductase [bacterium]
MKRTLIVLGHPNSESLCNALAESYEKGARENGSDVRLLKLYDLKFNPFLEKGYNATQKLEQDLEKAKEGIEWAEHLVFVYPVWWASVPAVLKGFIDRVFTPGFAFNRKNGLPEKLLKGRTGRLIVTMDSPKWYYKWFMKNSSQVMMKKGVLEFCGIKPVKITEFTPIKSASESRKQIWIDQVYDMGKSLA